ncbi:Uncharacterised protein [uncultured Clostridium sp.]|uniref:hypothetical protein n=1 Tax=uncultured Clostridium sp. TaxID=59620 RepID=UPI0008211FBD|nr:hypothetical protein [uncultured Clostridium sp.]SCJ59914.1 Uncharacterised protein [uncultured Clostridium sp.]
MKKFISLIFITIFLLTLLSGCSSSENSTIIGIYLESKNDTHMIICESICPIVMSNKSKNDTLFDDLQTGDKIKITCTSVAESYPGQCGVYKLKLINKGSIEDINKETLAKLKELGWMD